jgi:uncharacterized membrane protein YfcA
MDPLVIAFGLGVGILVGLTGIGGGSLMTPLLVIFIGTNPVVAVGTDIAYGAVTKTFGGWRHWRNGTVDMGVSKWLAFGSVPGSVAGVLLISHLHHVHGDAFNDTLLWIVAGVLATTALITLARALFMPALVARERHEVPLHAHTKLAAVLLGLLLGFTLGMTSVGSGALVGLALILVFSLTPHRVVGTDVFHAAIMLWAAGIALLFVGNIDWGLMGTILIGSLPGVWIGTNLATRMPKNALRAALGVVLLASSLALLSKAGLELPPFVLVLVPVVLAVVCFLLLRRRGMPEASPS